MYFDKQKTKKTPQMSKFMNTELKSDSDSSDLDLDLDDNEF